jgi:uncharacterized membrane protein
MGRINPINPVNHVNHVKKIFYLLIAFLLLAINVFAGADDTAAGKSALAPQFGWTYNASGARNIHILRGLWTDQYRIEEAISRSGGGVITEGWHWVSGGSGWPTPWPERFGSGIFDFPFNPSEMANNDLIIISNINADAINAVTRVRLREYVKNGGSVLVLGGRFAFGEQYRNTALEEMMPVTFPAGFGFLQPEGGVVLTPTNDELAKKMDKLSWNLSPRTYWMHTFTPKEGSRVVVKAGDAPLLVIGTFGKGRVGYFAGTVLCESTAGQTAFWDWDGWPVVLGNTIQWLTDAPRAANHAPNDDFDKKIEAAIAGTAKDAWEKSDTLLCEAANACRDAASVVKLLTAAAGQERDFSQRFTDIAIDRLSPVADKSVADVATQLIEVNMPGKRAVGLAMLGASNAPGALATLKSYLDNPQLDDEAPGEDGGDVLKPTMDMAEIGRPLVRLAALRGMGNLRDSKAIPFLKAALKSFNVPKFAAGHPTPENFLDTMPMEIKVYEQAVLSSALCGDDTSAGTLIDCLQENRYIIARARMEKNKPKDRLEQVQKNYPAINDWQKNLLRQLENIPAAVHPAIAKRLAKETDPRIIQISDAIFAGKKITPEVSAVLKMSVVKGISN